MRKAFIALGVIVVVLLSALFIANQQPKYAGVSMPKSDYKQLQRSQREIKDFVQTLDRFDYNKPKTMTAIENTGNVIIKDNSENLSSADAQALRDAFYGDQGIITIVHAAQKGHYNIDGSVASRFHDKFDTIITLSVNALNKSSAQRADIVKQMKTDLNIESAIYKIGARNDE
ncbi:molecular chaperone [Leuconostoc lactis]|uniref:molecular chaperone n=1 Tax=Leuconostoc lactis TaxID=1246 RepID=UPI0021A8F0B4|nr:molecular chaperone [Leuconostoc lactis]MCT3114623.1 molecular chaperone [Leuconostoc lactis]